MTPERKEAENLVYKTMDALDPSKRVSNYYRELFSKMSDVKFKKFISGKYPYRFHTRIFDIEPSMDDIKKATDVLGIPLLEKVAMPYIYKNKEGKPVMTHEALVGYIHLKKMKQFLISKNSMSTNIAIRDNKTGRLTGADKNGQTSDREMESLVVSGMDHTIRELSTARADSMEAKQQMYNTISTVGQVSEEDIKLSPTDSLSKNMLNVYMLGSHLDTNLIDFGYMTPITYKNRKVSRREEG